MRILWELSITNVNFLRAEFCKCEFHKGWALWAEHWECEFVRAGHCKYEFDERWVLWMLILWELIIVNVSFMRAEHCVCDFSRAEHCECEFMRAEHWKCEFNENWALWMWILWALSITNMNLWELSFIYVNFMRAEHWEQSIGNENLWELGIANMNLKSTEHCECEFYERWALRMRILWELSITNVNFMRIELCKCEFYEGWALWAEHWECDLWELSIANMNSMSTEFCEY